MTDQLISGVVTVATAIVGIAILAVLVSRSAQTPQVISSAGDAFSGAIKAAVSPLNMFTGGQAPGYPYQNG